MLHVRLPQDEFDTLGGLVFGQLRAIPEDGTTPVIEAYGLRVQVEEILDHRVEKAIVTKLDEEKPEDREDGDGDGRD
jgi:putative hemolysin